MRQQTTGLRGRGGRRWVGAILLAVASSLVASAWAAGGDENWSLQFPQPAQVAQMSAATGMSDGVGQPSVRKLEWHEGKLWIAGRWEAGLLSAQVQVQLRGEATAKSSQPPDAPLP